MKPWLYLSAHWAHKLSPLFLPLWGYWGEQEIPQWKSVKWRNLYFPNPVGIAGGVDKNGELISTWWKLGSGFLELGTVTPYSQKANAGKILDRDLASHTLWNKMGFPNKGAQALYDQLLPYVEMRPTPIFANIGKNRTTPNHFAAEDYCFSIERLNPLVDGFVINVSSPNTQGLRALQSEDQIKILIEAVRKKTKKALLIKLSPDIEEKEFEKIILTCAQCGADGFVLTNTTTSRSSSLPYPKEGGVSGLYLANLSRQALRNTISILGKSRENMLIISVGGILTPEDVNERLILGADLVEIYSALVFYGPRFFQDCKPQKG